MNFFIDKLVACLLPPLLLYANMGVDHTNYCPSDNMQDASACISKVCSIITHYGHIYRWLHQLTISMLHTRSLQAHLQVADYLWTAHGNNVIYPANDQPSLTVCQPAWQIDVRPIARLKPDALDVTCTKDTSV